MTTWTGYRSSKMTDVHKLQELLRNALVEKTGVSGQLGFFTWCALDQPSGWQVFCQGQWWDADELRERITNADW